MTGPSGLEESTDGRAGSGSPSVGALMTSELVTLDAAQPIQEAINLFAGREFRHIPVVHGGCLVGVLSDRDALRAFAIGKDPSTPIATIMRADPHSVRIATPVVDAIRLLLEHRINCLPVVDADNVLVGILTTTDLLHAMLTIHTRAA